MNCLITLLDENEIKIVKDALVTVGNASIRIADSFGGVRQLIEEGWVPDAVVVDPEDLTRGGVFPRHPRSGCVPSRYDS